MTIEHMNIPLVGGRGRGHALAWKIVQSPRLGRLVVAPGNPGIATLAETRPIAADDVEGLVALAREIGADLVVVGPEAALEKGLADRLEALGVPCFGPTAAAQLVTTNDFTTTLAARRHHPPT